MLLSVDSYGISTTPRSNNPSLDVSFSADAGSEAIVIKKQHQPQKDTSKEGLFDLGVVLIPYESILRSMCPSERALKVRTSGERSESFALGKCFAVAKLTTNLCWNKGVSQVTY